MAPRYIHGGCVPCALERQRKWDAKNPDATSAKAKRWRAKNRPKLRELDRAWYAANPERKQEHNKRWVAKNREAAATISRNRAARKKAAPGRHTKDDVLRLLALQRYRCPYCEADLRQVKRHVDHRIPLIRGGSNGPENLQVLCQPCNNKKHAKDPIEFAQAQGFLL